MTRLYLTIDDSPCERTDDLTDALVKRGIPAVFYCTGGEYFDFGARIGMGIENNPAPIERAIQKGFVIGNHTYSHRRSSEMGFAEIVAEIEKTEALIDTAYRRTGRARPHKLLRFPHIDRGCGGWIVDYDTAGPYGDTLKKIFGDGLNVTLDPPSQSNREKKEKIAAYLKAEGFTTDCFTGITHPWYVETEMNDAHDALYTFSTSDWMMNPAFTKPWPYKTVQALKDRIDRDQWLNDPGSAQLVLAHDQAGTHDATLALIDHMAARGMTFLDAAV